MSDQRSTAKAFRIFRAADAPDLHDAGCMTVEPLGDQLETELKELIAAGLQDGEEIRVLVNIPGFSLTHVWFKRDFPLPLHSHNVDCLYYVVAGSVRMGGETLGARDSFFVPANVPYTYRPGPDGVELLEIRTANSFNFVNHAKGQAFWDKAIEAVNRNREDWITAKLPALNS